MGDRNQHTEGRFYVEALPVGEEALELPAREAIHAGGSRRLAAGDFITLFDGSGWDVIAEIVSAGRGKVEVRAVSRRNVGPPLCLPVTCATALPKGSREDILVSKCAELGVTRFVPLEFERSVVRPSAHWEKRKTRYRRLAIEAAKQSGASTVMEICEPLDFGEFTAAASRGLRLIGVPGARESVIDALSGTVAIERVTYVVGPEGGIAPEEVERAAGAGFVPVRIGPTILRIETAAIAFSSVVGAFLGARRG